MTFDLVLVSWACASCGALLASALALGNVARQKRVVVTRGPLADQTGLTAIEPHLTKNVGLQIKPSQE